MNMAVSRFVDVSEEKVVSQQILTTVMFSIRVQTTLKHIRFAFCQNIKDNERNLCQDLLTIENTNSDLKVRELHYLNELLVRVRLSFQKRLQPLSTCRSNKNCLGKER